MSTLSIIIIVLLELLMSDLRQEKEIRSIKAGKEEAKLLLFTEAMAVYISKSGGAPGWLIR